MKEFALDGHLGRPVTIDLCDSCQALWFDKYESLQLSAASVLRLFRVIGQASGARGLLSGTSRCPRCARNLHVSHDLQRSTKFEYLACPDNHGRLITFFNFLREKDFIRPLSPAQIDELRSQVRTINCSNCGAPVDLALGTVCLHCGSSLSMLDVKQAEDLITRLQQAGKAPHAPERLQPSESGSVRRPDLAFGPFAQTPDWFEHASTDGLIGAALGVLAGWIVDEV